MFGLVRVSSSKNCSSVGVKVAGAWTSRGGEENVSQEQVLHENHVRRVTIKDRRRVRRPAFLVQGRRGGGGKIRNELASLMVVVG